MMAHPNGRAVGTVGTVDGWAVGTVGTVDAGRYREGLSRPSVRPVKGWSPVVVTA